MARARFAAQWLSFLASTASQTRANDRMTSIKIPTAWGFDISLEDSISSRTTFARSGIPTKKHRNSIVRKPHPNRYRALRLE